MARAAQATIPAAERLFRGLLPDWVEGDRVLPAAVDLNGMSVNREAYSQPRSVLSEKWTRVASVAQQDFPPPIELNTVTWDFIAVDLPVEGNDAHAEVRPHRVGETSRDTRKPNSPPAKDELRARLAAVMLVLPTTT